MRGSSSHKSGIRICENVCWGKSLDENCVSLLFADLKTEEDLASYLHRQYDQVLKAGIAIEATIQAMVTVTSQFMSSKQLDNPQKAAVSFIHKCLTLSSAELKEKHSNEGLEEMKKNKITEYVIVCPKSHCCWSFFEAYLVSSYSTPTRQKTIYMVRK